MNHRALILLCAALFGWAVAAQTQGAVRQKRHRTPDELKARHGSTLISLMGGVMGSGDVTVSSFNSPYPGFSEDMGSGGSFGAAVAFPASGIVAFGLSGDAYRVSWAGLGEGRFLYAFSLDLKLALHGDRDAFFVRPGVSVGYGFITGRVWYGTTQHIIVRTVVDAYVFGSQRSRIGMVMSAGLVTSPWGKVPDSQSGTGVKVTASFRPLVRMGLVFR